MGCYQIFRMKNQDPKKMNSLIKETSASLCSTLFEWGLGGKFNKYSVSEPHVMDKDKNRIIKDTEFLYVALTN